MNFETNRFAPPSQKHNCHIPGKIAKWAERADIPTKSTIFKPPYQVSVLGFLHSSNTSHDSNPIKERAAMWLFSHVMEELAKAALLY